METGNINIYGKLVAQTGEGKVADTDQIFDKTLGKFQSEINGERENYYTKDEIDNMVEAIKQFKIQIANTLPEASESTMFTIYLIPSSNPKTTNSKDEYITIKSGNAYSWEQVGSTEIDLSGYSTTEEMNAAILSGLNNLSFSTGEKVANLGVDEEPIAGSDNLVKSGGVKNELALGAVYNVSAKNPTAGHNSDGKWESLYALLTDANLSTLIPTPVRKGGMSIKFIQSSDNKYVQYRFLLSGSFTDTQFANTYNWISVEDEVLKQTGIYVSQTAALVVSESTQTVRVNFATSSKGTFKVAFDGGTSSALAIKVVLYKDIVNAQGFVYESGFFAFNQQIEYSGNEFNIAIFTVYANKVATAGDATVIIKTGLVLDIQNNRNAINDSEAKNLSTMFYTKGYLLSGSATYDNNGLVVSSNVVWSDGITGILTKSIWDDNALEYKRDTVSHGTQSIQYDRIYNSMGEVSKETITIN